MWRGGTCRTEMSVACESDIREVDAQGSHILLLYPPIVKFAAECVDGIVGGSVGRLACVVC
ncbi:uncharacterized protein VDAG_00521 [Verticillium dahliae VdLs.17]|uniref:Uncharacterized protein n=1 Tax=Verticillium dahliae (strain VdLs.17 / ATCC MYA-4575 / FGSC 10137) TaxID=498257 RepID=G2WQ79_VERDV|nr:uncharacterized protein VDAG_00521 [Verticillium dahliae VdLs.17]EGY13839.1 hypothetical protein VDAG_00521 [Verticillium dahliae VdLs.17]